MNLRRNTTIIYITILFLLTATTLAALYNGGYQIGGEVVAIIAFVSIITSLLPFFISMRLFKKQESNPKGNTNLKVWGLIIYLFCFPVKCWIIISNIILLINGGDGWSFG
jgi:predicted Co/Zn/Cd cation transporter (cation efflux family)